MILKNKEGKVRLLWRLFLLVVPFLLAAYLLRYVPIRIQTRILMEQGLSESAALSQARNLFLEDPIGSSIIGIVQGLLWYGLVCLLVRSIEKRPCSMRSFGLSLTRKSPVLLALGFILGLLMYFCYFTVDQIFAPTPIGWPPAEPGLLPVILVSLDMLVNGFGEETAFRAYWQRLLVDRHGLWLGILLASTSFVLLHLLVARFTITALFAGILLACLLGILYVWTGSIFLVGALHASLNLIPRLLNTWPSDMSLLIIHSLALAITAFLIFRKRSKPESKFNHLATDDKGLQRTIKSGG
jgi:membrane protease YdiL (CAAX protease family)